MEFKTIQNNYLKVKKPLIWGDDECDFMKNNFPYRITFDRNIKRDILRYALIMDKDKCIIDAGGHIGDGAVAFAHTLREIGREDIFVYAIEPEKYKCDFIEKIKELNKLENLVVINCGLSDKEGTYKKIEVKGKNTGSTNFEEGDGFNFTTLDNLKKDGIITHDVGIIHYDLEGMEQIALDGSLNILKTDKPYLSCENHKRAKGKKNKTEEENLYNLPEGYNYIKVINQNQIYEFQEKSKPIVHQLFGFLGDTEMPEMFKKNQKKIIELCKERDYDYMLWTPSNVEDILKHYPQYRDFYNNLRFNIMRVDILRFLILHLYGGIYLDLDIEICNNFKLFELVKSNFACSQRDLFYETKKRIFKEIEILQMVKNHPMVFTWIDYVISQIKEKDAMNNYYEDKKMRYVLHTTGPYAFTRFVEKYNIPHFIFNGRNIEKGEEVGEWTNEQYISHYSCSYLKKEKGKVKIL